MPNIWARLNAKIGAAPTPSADAAPPGMDLALPVRAVIAPVDLAAAAPGLRPETIRLVEEMASYANFVEIMQRHLGNVCSGTQAAAEDILGQVQHIESDLTGLVRHVTDTMHSDAFVEASESVLVSIDVGNRMIDGLISEHRETQAHIRDSLAEVHRISGRMRGRLADIENIRRHTDLLAINARIRIATLGQQTGLDVIAQEIRGLATRTGELAESLRQDLGAMDETVSGRLMHNVTDQEARDTACTDQLQANFGKLSANMQRMIEMQGELIEAVRTRGTAMGGPLINLCGSIQFQDVARQQLEQVGEALSMISDHFVKLSQAIINGDAPPDSSISLCLAHILENYVMEEQRAAHFGPNAVSAGPPIELF